MRTLSYVSFIHFMLCYFTLRVTLGTYNFTLTHVKDHFVKRLNELRVLCLIRYLHKEKWHRKITHIVPIMSTGFSPT